MLRLVFNRTGEDLFSFQILDCPRQLIRYPGCLSKLTARIVQLSCRRRWCYSVPSVFLRPKRKPKDSALHLSKVVTFLVVSTIMQLVRFKDEHEASKQEKWSNFMSKFAPSREQGKLAVDELRRHRADRKVQIVGRRKTDRDWYALESAARMIQSTWRRHAACKSLRRHLMARKIQNCYRCITAELVLSQRLLALDIQTAYRCSVQRKKYGQFLCCRMTQSWWRGRSVRFPDIKYMACR
jgi:hypothetical protein